MEFPCLVHMLMGSTQIDGLGLEGPNKCDVLLSRQTMHWDLTCRKTEEWWLLTSGKHERQRTGEEDAQPEVFVLCVCVCSCLWLSLSFTFWMLAKWYKTMEIHISIDLFFNTINNYYFNIVLIIQIYLWIDSFIYLPTFTLFEKKHVKPIKSNYTKNKS